MAVCVRGDLVDNAWVTGSGSAWQVGPAGVNRLTRVAYHLRVDDGDVAI
jgi:hypothetical protein